MLSQFTILMSERSLQRLMVELCQCSMLLLLGSYCIRVRVRQTALVTFAFVNRWFRPFRQSTSFLCAVSTILLHLHHVLQVKRGLQLATARAMLASFRRWDHHVPRHDLLRSTQCCCTTLLLLLLVTIAFHFYLFAPLF